MKIRVICDALKTIYNHEFSQIFIRQYQSNLLLSGCIADRRSLLLRQTGKEGRRSFCHQIGRHHDALSRCRACRSGTADHRTHLPRDTKYERSIQNQVRIHVWHFQNHIPNCFPSLPASSIPQKWDELRRKVLNIQPQLPSGSSVPTVSDDFGDVFGIYYGLTADDGLVMKK